jgi:hypothetical protein
MFDNVHKASGACESLGFLANPERGAIGCRGMPRRESCLYVRQRTDLLDLNRGSSTQLAVRYPTESPQHSISSKWAAERRWVALD